MKLQLATDIAILNSMDRDLKQHLEAMENRFMTALQSQIGEVRGQIGELGIELREEIERVETRFLAEFHKWGRTSDMRTRQAITDTGILSERMLAVEDRVSALERQRSA